MFEHAVVIASLDPDEHLGQTVQGLREEGFGRIVVVDDGSGPSFMPIFGELESSGVHVVHHEVNRGQGAAIKTGTRTALELWPGAGSSSTDVLADQACWGTQSWVVSERGVPPHIFACAMLRASRTGTSAAKSSPASEKTTAT